MKHVDLYNIKLNHIRIFLAAAEYGSFTIAAEKLHLTQPFVSKAILHLEEELGLYLFIRGSRKFQITPAGRKLYQEWKGIWEQFEDSLMSAHSIQAGLTDQLRIGLGELSQENNFLQQNLKKTKEALPGLDIYIAYGSMSYLLDLLIKDEMDLVVVSKHMLPVIESTNLTWQTIAESYLSVYVHKSSPLYEQETLEFADLKREKFIVFSSEKDNSYIELLKHLAKEAGFTPMISCYVPNEISFKVNLEMGKGVVLADSLFYLDSEDIKRFDFPQRNDVIAVWKPENYRESMQTLLSFF